MIMSRNNRIETVEFTLRPINAMPRWQVKNETALAPPVLWATMNGPLKTCYVLKAWNSRVITTVVPTPGNAIPISCR